MTSVDKSTLWGELSLIDPDWDDWTFDPATFLVANIPDMPGTSVPPIGKQPKLDKIEPRARWGTPGWQQIKHLWYGDEYLPLVGEAEVINVGGKHGHYVARLGGGAYQKYPFKNRMDAIEWVRGYWIAVNSLDDDEGPM